MVFGIEHLDKESLSYQEQMLPAIRAGHFFHTPSPTPDPFKKTAKVTVSSSAAMIDLNATVAVYQAKEEAAPVASSIPVSRVILGVGVVAGILIVAQAVRQNKAAEVSQASSGNTAAPSNEIAVITPNTDMHIL
jgi:hypothetical protein